MTLEWDDEAVAMRWKTAAHTAADKTSTAGCWWRRGGTTRQSRRDGRLVVEVTWCVFMRCSLAEMFVGEGVRGNTFKSLASQKKLLTIRFQRAVEERLWHLF